MNVWHIFYVIIAVIAGVGFWAAFSALSDKRTRTAN